MAEETASAIAPDGRPQAGDILAIEIIRDPNAVYFSAENTSVTHVPFGPDAASLEVSFLANQTAFISQDATVVSTPDNSALTVRPGQMTAVAQVVYKGTVRLPPTAAAGAAVSILTHVKEHKLADLSEIREKLLALFA